MAESEQQEVPLAEVVVQQKPCQPTSWCLVAGLACLGPCRLVALAGPDPSGKGRQNNRRGKGEQKGKGGRGLRSKLKNYLTKSTNEITFRAGEKLQTADVEKRTMQYTYKDGEQFVFMDMETYEETRVDDDEFSKFLMEGTICEVLSWNGRVIGVDLPINVELEVKMTDPGIKGNTVSGGDKPAEVMTGAMVTVPLFIQIGEKIVVDTTSGKYVKRAKE